MLKLNTPDLMPLGEAGRVLGCSLQTLRTWVRNGRLDGFKGPNGRFLVRRQDVMKLLARVESRAG